MKVTSSEAAKILRKLENELNDTEAMEMQKTHFVAAIEEDIEKVRPEYDYKETQKKMDEIEAKIRKVKHAINVFNSTYTISELGMTIDQVLIYMPQLSRRIMRLKGMKSSLPVARDNGFNRNTNFIEYRYANYEIADAEADYERLSDLLAKVQIALDNVNNTVTFELDM